MGEVVPARTSPTLHPPSPPTVHQLSRLALYELTQFPQLLSLHKRVVAYVFPDVYGAITGQFI